MAIITETSDAVSDTSTVYTIAGGDQFRGTLDTTASTDWVRTNVADNKSYYWTLTGDGSANSLTRPYLYLYDNNGTQLKSATGGGLAYTPTTQTDLYMQVGTSSTYRDTDGNYRLNLVEEVADNINTTETLLAGQAVAGRSEYRSDRDWYEVTLNSDKSYYWTMTGDGSSDAVTRFNMVLFDANGTEVDTGGSGMAFTPTTAGTYYVQTGDGSSRSGQDGNYQLAMTAELPANDQTRATITAGETVEGRSEYNSDSDWYKVTLSSDESYFWTMTGDGSSDAVSSFNLTLFDANGTEVEDGNSGMAFTPATDGTYYVQTGNSYSTSGQAGVYTLGMTAELTANADTKGSIAAGQTRTGTSEYQIDRDWFKTTLDTGYSYYWNLAGDGSQDALERFRLVLFNANGTEQKTSTNLLTFTPSDAGTYFIQTGTNSIYGGDHTGNYELDMVRETSNGFGTLARIGTNETVNDTLDYRVDKDMYRTTLEAGRTYEITMRGDGGLESLDRAGVGIYSANGGELKVQRGTDSDVTVEFSATTTGTYFIQAGELGSYVGERNHGKGTYELEISKGTLSGTAGDDRLVSTDDGEILRGLDGNDTLIGNGGDDVLYGGETDQDRRDVIFGGDGDDTIDGGHGNDQLRGDAGDDVISGGFGGDTVIGGDGNDTVTGGALGDMLFGSDGNDFINGGFGYDQINGGAGADEFFHLGIFDHGSDWIQDYNAAQGDELVFGRATATANQFQINYASKANAGDADVAEAFVIYKPTGQIMWALIDGAGQDEINLRIGGDVFDLTA
ncbi:calcium-binding protein [Sulfitobacter sp. F26169L]|uniref:calcium-binding protein n=1 Tax=Sulfitobacter sp. F26169L TaxID=2996015 RepID=UPI002260D75C|nr:calcium-binding protein [Sulfitobacter sp. F26169L]MCX7568018.1 calcium-binding protein [Sulfitobacter sp. F26169L]